MHLSSDITRVRESLFLLDLQARFLVNKMKYIKQKVR